MDAVRVGLSVRALRRRRGWTQRELATRSGCSTSAICRLERGGAGRVSMSRLERVLTAMGARLAVRVVGQGEELDRLLDRDHATIVEAMIGILQQHGWLAFPEVTFSVWGERGSIDILGWHEPTRTLLVVEVKSVLPDVQATTGGLDRKARLAPDLAIERGWAKPAAVARLLVLPDDRTARRRVEAFARTFDRLLPARTAEIKRWLARPSGSLSGVLFLSKLPSAQPRQRVRAPRVSATHGVEPSS